MTTDPTTTTKAGAIELDERALNDANGGVLIGLLLPAVQKVRESTAVRSFDRPGDELGKAAPKL